MKPKNINGALAVIDVGSHSTRLKIAQVADGDRVQTLESVNHPLPLGADVVSAGKIHPRNISLTGEILADFTRLMTENGVVHSRAVISSSAAEALNLDLFLHQVRNRSGITLEVLEPAEEIRLIYLSTRDALRGRLNLDRRNVMICSVGTGCSHVCFIQNGLMSVSETIRMGTLRIMEELGSVSGNYGLHQAVDPFVSVIMGHLQEVADRERPELFIAVGSPMQALVGLKRKGPNPALAKMSRKSFRNIFRRIVGEPPEKLVAEFGISDYQALSLEPCCVMLEHFFEIAGGGDTLYIPNISTRDALLQDMIRKLEAESDVFQPQIISMAERLAAKFNCDRIHFQAVRHTATLLFDLLADVHDLGSRERLLLELAAILHEAGLFVSNRQHHKHSYYLLHNCEIPGVMAREQEIVALVSRYHRRAAPKNTHFEYMQLTVPDRILVTKLAAILRLADALDRSHAGRVLNPRFSREKNKILINTKTGKDLHLERWALDRKTKLFTEVFGLKPVLVN